MLRLDGPFCSRNRVDVGGASLFRGAEPIVLLRYGKYPTARRPEKAYTLMHAR
jgi:hypothetical protein